MLVGCPCCVWFIAISNASLFCVAWILSHDKLQLASWWTLRAFTIFSIIVSTFSYSKIFFTLRHQQAQVGDHVQPEQSSRARSVLNIARYKKTVYSVAWIQFAMLACYGPKIVLVFLLHFGNIDDSIEIRIADEFSVCLVFLNSSLNPVLYCWRIKDIRRKVQNTIRKCLCCWVNQQWWRKDATEQHLQWEDNWLATNSAAVLIPAHTTYADRTQIVHRISYPFTLIFFFSK